MSLDGLVQMRGGAVTLELDTLGYDASTGRTTPSTTSMTGNAREVAADIAWLRELGLVETATRTLRFIPTTAGDIPALGARLTWAGAPSVVRGVKPYAPSGVTLHSLMVIDR